MYDTKTGREMHAWATPGEWEVNEVEIGRCAKFRLSENVITDEKGTGIGAEMPNAAFIAHAHNAFPQIMDELDAARTEIERLRLIEAKYEIMLQSAVMSNEQITRLTNDLDFMTKRCAKEVERYAAMRAERDAAVADMTGMVNGDRVSCDFCKWDGSGTCAHRTPGCFQWRGLKEG